LFKRRPSPTFSVSPLIIYENEQKIEDIINEEVIDEDNHEELLKR
jgi:hypothetical protein